MVSFWRSAFCQNIIWWNNISISCLTELKQICVLLCALSSELKGLGPDFVFGFVQSMDGERDPRNLLLAFQIAKGIVLRSYDLGESAKTHI